MKIKKDRSAFYGILGETIDIYQAEHAVSAAFVKLGGYSSATRDRCKVVVGHDDSPAADMMTSAVCAALCASGADVITLGLVPSGAVSCLTSICEATMGVMITGGSFDNSVSGLKFYQKDGRQVTGELLQAIHDATEDCWDIPTRMCWLTRFPTRFSARLRSATSGTSFPTMTTDS